MITHRFDMENVENGGSLADRGKPTERSMEDLAKSSSSSGSYGMTRAARALTVRWEALQSRRLCLQTWNCSGRRLGWEMHIGLNAIQRRSLASLVGQVFRGIRGQSGATVASCRTSVTWLLRTKMCQQSFRFSQSCFGGKLTTFQPIEINPRDLL